jgi:hypothetical protein
MEPWRWIRGAVPIGMLALVGAWGISRPPLLAAADPVWQPPRCTDAGPPGRPSDGRGAAAWYRVDGVLDSAGTLSGQRLRLGLAGGVTHRMDLPAESFATGPVGSVVLVGANDGRRSRLSLVDVARSCSTEVADDPAVVRSALLEPGGMTLVEHRVDRVTRADLGVWRVPLAGGRSTRILGGAVADATYGRTFSTELRIASDGRVVVTSCGDRACRTRIADATSNRVTQVGPTGPVVGVWRGGGVVAYGLCLGSPCPVMRFGDDGDVSMLAADAGRAALAGDRLVFQVPGGGLDAVDLRDGSRHAVDPSGGLDPVGDGSRATAGIGHPLDVVVLAPAGGLDGRNARAVGRRAWAPVALEEVGR